MSIPCYSFYSYKGGSGRSTVLMNTVKYLADKLCASPMHPILVVDADLESAGLTYLFDCERRFIGVTTKCINTCRVLFSSITEYYPQEVLKYIFGNDEMEKRDVDNSLIDLLNEFIAREEDKISRNDFEGVGLCESEWEIFSEVVEECKSGESSDKMNRIYEVDKLCKKIKNENNPNVKTKIIINSIPSTRFCDISDKIGKDAWTVRFLGIDTANPETLGNIQNIDHQTIIDSLLERCELNNYAAIVFDSGSGSQSSSHVLHTFSNVIVYCMRPSNQFIEGTKMQLGNYEKELLNIKKTISMNEESKPVIIFPNAVPKINESNSRIAEISKRQFDRIIHISDSLFPVIVDNYFCNYNNCLKEVEIFKWEELNLSKLKDDEITFDDERNARSVYEELAQRIIKNT